MTAAIKKNFPAAKTNPKILSTGPRPLSELSFLKATPTAIITSQKAAKVTRKPVKLTAEGFEK